LPEKPVKKRKRQKSQVEAEVAKEVLSVEVGENLVSDDEKKQKEVMKKYYRNRYSSFLQALA
jgi:hypothetical protein